MIFFYFLTLTSLISVAYSYNILGVLPFQAKSHYAFIDPLMVRLAELGHNVTIYDPYPKSEKLPNYNEIDVSECFVFGTLYEEIDTFIKTAASPFSTLWYSFEETLAVFQKENFDKCAPLKELLNSTVKYDLFITEAFLTDLTLLFVNKFKIPFITCTPNVPFPWLADRMGNPLNPSYVPNVFSDYPFVKMTFFNRLWNTLFYIMALGGHDGIILRNEENINKYYFGSSAPSLYNIARETSIMLINAHETLNPVIPLVPGMIPVSGIHIKQPAALPQVCYHS